MFRRAKPAKSGSGFAAARLPPFRALRRSIAATMTIGRLSADFRRAQGRREGVAMPRHRDQTGDDARKRPAVLFDRPFPIHARFAVRPATMRESSGAWIKQRPLVAVMAAAPSSLDTVEQIA